MKMEICLMGRSKTLYQLTSQGRTKVGLLRMLLIPLKIQINPAKQLKKAGRESESQGRQQ